MLFNTRRLKLELRTRNVYDEFFSKQRSIFGVIMLPILYYYYFFQLWKIHCCWLCLLH